MSHPIPEYDVFLSFRGEDTREKFTSHVCKELRGKNIKTFIDDDKLKRGDEIKSSLVEAIKESLIYVVILSKHYASSRWCLDELTEILKCKEEYGREVIPVFYEVDPSDVRHQRNSYADDLVKHHQQFGGKVGAWKAALTQVANLSGWDSRKFSPESTLVEKIAEGILKKLNRPVSSDYYEGMTAMDKHIKQIQSLLKLELETVRIIGIWGMGGIGKTTIAKAIFEKLAIQFNSKSIVLNVQQEIKRAGLSHVKSKYLSQLLLEDIKSSDENFSCYPRLKRTNALLVFDDLKDSNQLKDLIGTSSNFGEGSRIIVTSRDKQVLLNANADEIYKVREMDDQDSLQLFHSFAFKHNHPIEKAYVSLSKKVLDYANGVPLALQVLGSLLYGKSMGEWESQLQKLEKLPEDDIFNVMKLSYDGLDDNQKDIFLDMTCFFRGGSVKVVEQILDWYGFIARIGMKVLEDRCLISISEDTVWMHDLIQEMGHRIVELQNKDPGKRSRLWKSDDIYEVLKKNKGKGTDAIQCIALNMKKRKDVQLHAETFKKMHNLRMIWFYNQYQDNQNWTFNGFLKSFPNNLKLLYWEEFPQRSLPQDFFPENLVTLAMYRSHLEQLWERDQALPNLKSLLLSCSRKLKRLPDLSLCPNIEKVILSDCESLTEVYSSSFLDNLKWLCLDGCTKLKSLKIHSNILWRSSGLVALHDCHSLQTLLINCKTNVFQSDNWTPLYQDGKGGYDIGKCSFTGINELCWLDVSYCRSLTCLPAELLNLKFLTRLSLSGCLKLEVLPEIEETMENLIELTLNETAIKELPSSVHHLVGLEELNLQDCTKLKNIPSSIGNLGKLLKLNLFHCASLETFPSSIFKLKLTELNFEGCSMLQTFPEILEPAESFTRINLTNTTIKELPSSLDRLVGLEELSLRGCTKLKTIPSSIGNLSKLLKLNLAHCASLETFPSSIFKLKLTKLDFDGCSMLQTFPEIPNDSVCLSSLTKISLQGSRIVNLHESMAHLSSLKSLNLSDCKLLEFVPKLPPNLNQVSAFDCPSIKRMVLNSRSNSREGIFKFHLTNTEELIAASWSNIIGEEACIMITDDAYVSVFFCFPGSEIPNWFPYCCKGHSVNIGKVSPNLLIGFAVCVVLGLEEDMYDVRIGKARFMYKFGFISDGEVYSYDNYYMPEATSNWSIQDRFINQDHTLIWKHQLDLKTIGNKLLHAHSFTFEILDVDDDDDGDDDDEPYDDDDDDGDDDDEPYFLTRIQSSMVKEFGICPLYSGNNDDNRLAKRRKIDNNSIEEPSGSKAAE